MIHLDKFIIKKEKNGPRKLYLFTCNNCNNELGYDRKLRRASGLCKDCFGTIRHKDKAVSAETRQRMSDNNHIKNGGRHPLLGKSHSESTKAKLSLIAILQNKGYSNKKHQYVGLQGAINMKSSWEVKYAQYLDSVGIGWLYEPTFKLNNGKAYLPDFQLSNGDIIEVKGFMREDAKVKWEMFCNEYPALNKSLVTKVEMKQLKLI